MQFTLRDLIQHFEVRPQRSLERDNLNERYYAELQFGMNP